MPKTGHNSHSLKEGAIGMENIIKMVVSIDQKASDMKKQTEVYLKTKEENIKENVESMRSEVMDKAKNDAKSLYDSIIKEAEDEAERVRNKTKEELGSIESRFLKMKETIEGQLFSKIFN